MSQVSLPTITPLVPADIPAIPAQVGVSWVPIYIDVRRLANGTWQASFDVVQVTDTGTPIDETLRSFVIEDILGAGGQKYPLILTAAGAIIQATAQILQAGGLA